MEEAVLVRGLAAAPRTILIVGDRIAAVDADAERRATGARTVELDGLRAVPGLIDLQVNGIGAVDFTSDPASLWRAGHDLAAHGVTSFLATIISSPPGTVEAALTALAERPSNPAGAVPLGLHVEGPFISPARHGAHDPRHLRPPDLGELSDWTRRGARIVTLAPELPGGLDAIELIAANGALAAVGHTDADHATAVAAIERGARYATHLFNAMPPLGHRAPGPVAALLGDTRVTVGLIADGIHVAPPVLGIAARAAAGSISLVSDVVADRLGGAPVTADARRPDGTLAGSRHGLDRGLRVMARLIGLGAAIEAVTATPARLLGLDDGRGEIRVGGRADVVFLSDELTVAATLVAGRPAHVTADVGWE